MSNPFSLTSSTSNAFGQQSSGFGQHQSPVFGQTQQSTSTLGGSVFGQQQGSILGQSIIGQQQGSAFGQATQTPAFGQPTPSPAFGQPAQGPVFGQTTQSPAFGQPTQSLAFGQTTQNPAFGQTTKNPAFGQTTQNPAFGQTTQNPTFGQTTKNPAFGQTTQSPAFGQSTQSPVFEQTSQPSQQGSVFGQSTQSPLFGQSSQLNQPAFGQTSQTKNLFGQPSNDNSQQSPVFGQTTQAGSQGGFGQVSQTGSVFGNTVQSNLFGQTTQASQQSGSFGGQTGQFTATSQGPVFGQSSQIGQQQNTGFGTGPTFGGSGSFQSPTSTLGGTTTTSNAFGARVVSTNSGFGGQLNTTSTAFGGGTSSTDSAFGDAVGSTTSSGFGGTSHVFGGTNRNSFGGAGTSASGFGGTNKTTSSGTAFGGPGDTKNVFRSDKISGTGFGRTVASFGGANTGTSTGTTTGFGGTGTNVTSSTGSSSLFGGTIKTEASDKTQRTAFGGTNQVTSGTVFGGVKRTTSAVFAGTTSITTSTTGFGGATAAGKDPFGTNSRTAVQKLRPPSTTLITHTENRPLKTSAFGGTTESTRPTQVFGIKKEPTSEPSAPPKTVGLFGKAVQSVKENTTKSMVLFGKQDIKKEPDNNTSGSSRKSLFGKSADDGSTGSDKRPFKRRQSDEGKGRVLFGKVVGPSDKPSDGKRTSRLSSDESIDEPQSKRTALRRLPSVTDDPTRIAIVCKNVPNKINNAFELRKHFSKFGLVTKVFPNPNKQSATIHFKNNTGAAEAKRRGSFVRSGLPVMSIFWSSYSPRSATTGRTPSEEEDANSNKRKADDHGPPKTYNRKWERSDVNQELEAMAGTRDISRGNFKSLSRPEERSDFSSVAGPSSPAKQVRSSSPVRGATFDKEGVSTLLKSVARNSAEKLQILSVRDRVIRQVLKTQKSKSVTAQAFIGTCTDMCPERERYDREEKRRLHVYEIAPGADMPGQNPPVDHTRAVKEYSRASADQEEPLPHELRPVPVLEMTMNYLLNEIADRGQDGKWGEWYDFLWDRTRGLRKDITQQQLCCREAVEVLEKCVRFHIFCGERLCEEDAHCFDAKINNENMTKCLQTLKEFYYDLEKKDNVFCQNEAEMRSYMILMNLNEGDILRETQGLRSDVRNTPYINFALQVYSALNSNNYVRFFRLVKHGSFLHACLMHRYFTQVRRKALMSMLRAYKKGVQYPLEDLIRTLGFEHLTEAGTFCQHYGLVVNDDYFIMDRSSFIEPEASWTSFRSEKLIESKRILSIGETINGEKLPPLQKHTPVTSFDSSGRFIGQLNVDDVNVDDTSAPGSPQRSQHEPVSSVEVKPEPVPVPEPVRSPMKFTNEMVKETAKNLFWEVIDDLAKQIGQEEMNNVQLVLDETSTICDQLVREVVHENAISLSQSMYNEVATLRRKQEHDAMVKQISVVMTTEVIVEVVNQEVLNIATAEVREAKAQLKKEQIERCSEDISKELISSVVSEFVESVSDEVYQKDVVARLQQLADIEKSIQLRIAGRYLQYWKKEYMARCKLKRSMLSFPASASMGTSSDQIQALIPRRQQEGLLDSGFFINEMARLSVESPLLTLESQQVIDKVLTAHDLYRKICHQKAWQPIDIGSVVQGSLTQLSHVVDKGKHRKAVYWKTVLSLPPPGMVRDKHQCYTVKSLNAWIRAKLTKGRKSDKLKGEVLSLYTTEIKHKVRDIKVNLGVCIRATEGIMGIDDDTFIDDFTSLLGTSGVILVLPPVITLDESRACLGEARERLDSVLSCKPSCPPIPLVIILPLSQGQEDLSDVISEALNLEQYFEQNKLSNICIQTFDYSVDIHQGVDIEDPSITEKLSESIQWLASEYPPPPDLTFKYIKDYIDDFLLDKYFVPVLHNLKQRKLKGYLHQEPSVLVTLYNDCIQHLADVASSDDLQKQSWPVSEFTNSQQHRELPHQLWNNESNLDYIRQVIHDIKLPYMEYSDIDSEEWSQVCKDVWKYVQELVGEDEGTARIDLFSRIGVLLKKTREHFEDKCYLTEGEEHCEPTYVNMPWADIIASCIDYQMMNTDFTHPEADRTQDNDSTEIRVVYMESELNKYSPPSEWKHLETDTDIANTVSLNATVERAVEITRKKINELSQIVAARQTPDITSTISEISSGSQVLENEIVGPNPRINLKPLSENEVKANSLTHAVTSALDMEKRESQSYEKYLSDVLNNSDSEYRNISNVSCLSSWSVFNASKFSPTDDVSFMTGIGDKTLSDSVVTLKNELESNRRDSDIFEQQLQAWMDS